MVALWLFMNSDCHEKPYFYYACFNCISFKYGFLPECYAINNNRISGQNQCSKPKHGFHRVQECFSQ